MKPRWPARPARRASAVHLCALTCGRSRGAGQGRRHRRRGCARARRRRRAGRASTGRRCSSQHPVQVGVAEPAFRVEPVPERDELVEPRVRGRAGRRRRRPCSLPQCGRPPTAPAIASSAAKYGPGSVRRGNVRRRCRRCRGPTRWTAGCRRRRRPAPRPGTRRASRWPRRRGAARRSTAGSVGARDGVLHLQEAHPAAADEDAVRSGRSRCAAPSAVADMRASGGTSAGTRAAGRRRPRERAVGEELVVHPPARQRGSGAPSLERHAVVALEQASRRCAGTSRTRRGRSGHELVEAARAARPGARGPSTARSANAGTACRVTAVTHPERAEPDPGGGEHVGVLGRRAVRDRAVGVHELAAPRTWAASPPSSAPVPCVPVEMAPATVCASMSPRLGSAQPRAAQRGVELVQRHARRGR